MYTIRILKQVGLAVWSKCWLSHLGVVGSRSGHDNLYKPWGREFTALMYDRWYKNHIKVGKFKWAHHRQRLSVVSEGAESHKQYVTERV